MEPGLIHGPFNFSGRVDPLETFQSFLEGILEVLVKQCLLTPFPYTHTLHFGFPRKEQVSKLFIMGMVGARWKVERITKKYYLLLKKTVIYQAATVATS